MISVRITKRFYALLIYSLRFLLKNLSTRKFLTGDGFAKIADLEFFPETGVEFRLRKVCSLELASTVFCPGYKVEEMLKTYGTRIRPRVLIIGNSDRDFYDFPQNLPKSVVSVYLQNSFISDGFFRTLPIGLENIRVGRNGLPFLFSRIFLYIPKKNITLVGPFSPTHTEREKLKDLKCEEIKILNERMSPVRMAYHQYRHKFIAVPRGNGVDTHRLWECLYRGSIPILLRNEWSRSISQLGLPVLLVDEWSNNSIIEAMNSCKFERFDPKEFEVLWLKFWKDEFSQ